MCAKKIRFIDDVSQADPLSMRMTFTIMNALRCLRVSDVIQVLAAVQFATKVSSQGGPKRSTEIDPNHSINVMLTIANTGESNPLVLCAAVLYNTVNHSVVSLEEVVQKFGQKVADLVAECLDDKELTNIESKSRQVQLAKSWSREVALIKLSNNYNSIIDPLSDWSARYTKGYVAWTRLIATQVNKLDPFLESKLALVFDEWKVRSMIPSMLDIFVEAWYRSTEQLDH